MIEEYEGVEFEIKEIESFVEGHDSRFDYFIYDNELDYQTGKIEIHKSADEWHCSEKEARKAAIEYITRKMQNGER